jgi:hypothetical protein
LFHAGHDDKRNISAYWTERIMSAYNAPLRQYLTAGTTWIRWRFTPFPALS